MQLKGIKWNEKLERWIASVPYRDRITGQPRNISKRFKTKAEAIRGREKLLIEKEFRQRRKVIPTWEKSVMMLVEEMNEKDLHPKTIETYQLCLEAHTFPLWKGRLVDSIKGSEIRQFIKQKMSHRSQSHQKNMLKYIRAVFNCVYEKDLINRNPCPKMKFQIGQKLDSVLTQQQANKLLSQAKAVRSQWYEIWFTALATGMRSGELISLTWDKINFEDRLIKVDVSWDNKKGYKTTKSGDARYVEISEELLILLRELKIKNLNPPFVLPQLERWSRGYASHDLRMFLEGIGLPRIRFHDLRASHATIMLTKGVEPIKLMASCGWKDLSTMQRYTRLSGVNIKGITKDLKLFDPTNREENILELNLRG